MNIEDGVRERLEQPGADEPHEAREADRCHFPGLQFGRERPIEVVPRLELAVIHHQRLDACIPRVFEPGAPQGGWR